MLQSSIVVAAIVLGFQPAGPLTQGGARLPAQAQQSRKPAPANGDALVDRLLDFFKEAARTGMAGFDPAYDAFSEMLDMAKQALADKRIDQRFFNRYERLLRIAALSSIPEKAGLLLPLTRPEIADFVRDVTGIKLEGGSGDLGKLSAALTTETLSLKGYPAPRASTPASRGVAPEASPVISSAARVADLERQIAAAPANPQAYLDLAQLQEDSGAVAEAEATLLKARQALATSANIPLQLAHFYNRRREFQKTMSMLQTASGIDPRDAELAHLIATFYYEKIDRDKALAPATRAAYIKAGLAAADRALGIEPDYTDALIYKALLLRRQAESVTDPGEKTRMLADADLLRTRAAAAREKPAPVRRQRLRAATSPQAPPPPPGRAPVRVGGEITPPVRIKNVTPEYPPEALASRTEGIVIVEATIGADGRVTNATIVRSVPLLDGAALAAVQQWLYEPTYVDGRAVAVIMTVTVTFALK